MSLPQRFSSAMIVGLLAVTTLFVTSCAQDPDTDAPPPLDGAVDTPDVDPGQAPPPPDSPKALVDLKCSMCHSVDQVYEAQYDRAGWESTIERMKRNGLVLTEEENSIIIEFLSQQ